jgi:transposase InsO family protein
MINEVKKANPGFKMNELCRIFDISCSSLYYKPIPQSAEKQALMQSIEQIFSDSDATYGKRRIRAELLDLEHQIGVYAIATAMKKLGLNAIKPKKKHYYPDTGDEQVYAPNLLKRQFNPITHNTHWVGDITYIKSHQGWSYLACVLDLGTKEIVGYALSNKPNAELANAALNNAIQRQRPNTQQLMFHSDQGCQYSANVFRKRLKHVGIKQSMSRRGNCWDNAVMERFFRSLKTEKLNHLVIINHASVVSVVEQYIQFYNYKRRHSAISYITPHQKYNELKKAA